MKKTLILLSMLGVLLLGITILPNFSERQAGLEQELVIALGMDPGGLDPHGSFAGDARIVWASLYETLVYLGENMEIVPRLASAWEVSEDAKTWTFKLREGVKFHDHSPFNAEAVRFTFERRAQKRPFAVRKNIEVVDNYTVKFHLTEPFAPFLSELTLTENSIISPSAVVDGEEFKPLGTGPWVFAGWVKEEQIVLRGNRDYWGKAPSFDQVTFRVIPDAQTRMLAFETGAVDVVGLGFGRIPPGEIPRWQNNPKAQLKIRTPNHDTVWLAMNRRNEFLRNLKPRKALAHAIDRESIVKHLLEEAVRVAVAPWSPTKIFGVKPGLRLPAYNLAKSKTLLAESGWLDSDGDGLLDKAGKPLRLSLMVQNTAPWRTIAEAAQEQLRMVGITLSINELERGAYLERLRAGDFELAGISGIGLPSDDPYMHIANFYHSRFGLTIGQEAPNPSLINNPKLDKLIEEMVVVIDPKRREAIYHQIQEMIVNETVGVYLYHGATLVALAPNLSGFTIPSGFWNLCLRGLAPR